MAGVRAGAAGLFLLAAGCGGGGSAGTGPDHPQARLLGALPRETRVGLAGAERPARAAVALLGSSFPLSAPAGPGPFAAGVDGQGAIGLWPEGAALPPWTGLAATPAGSHLALAAGPEAAARAAALAGRFQESSRAGLAGRPSWGLLGEAAPWRPGGTLVWLGARELVARLGAGPDWLGRSPGGGWQQLREVLNLEVMEALLVQVDAAGACRGGLHLWPDRVGLPGLLLPPAGGLGPGEPPAGPGLWLAWLLHPEGLARLVQGLEAAGGAPAQAFLQALPKLIGLDLPRDLPPALAGPAVLEVQDGRFCLVLALQEGAASARLRELLEDRRSALPGGGTATIQEGLLVLASGRLPASPPRPPALDPRGDRVGRLRWGREGGSLELSLSRAAWGLRLEGRLGS